MTQQSLVASCSFRLRRSLTLLSGLVLLGQERGHPSGRGMRERNGGTDFHRSYDVWH